MLQPAFPQCLLSPVIRGVQHFDRLEDLANYSITAAEGHVGEILMLESGTCHVEKLGNPVHARNARSEEAAVHGVGVGRHAVSRP
jgi:hypothetical protein